MSVKYETEADALAAAESAGWIIEHDRYGTTGRIEGTWCTAGLSVNRLMDAGADGWLWIIEDDARPG